MKRGISRWVLSRAALLVVASCVWLLALVPLPAVSAERVPEGSVVHFGILFDSDSEAIGNIVDSFVEEIRNLSGDAYDLRFERRLSLGQDWTRANAQQALEEMFADPEVDIILTAGYVTSTTACQLGPAPKPVFAPFTLDAELQGLRPTPEGTSGIHNLNYLSAPAVATLHLDILQRLAPVRKLALVGPPIMFEANPEFPRLAAALCAPKGVELLLVPLSPDAKTTLAAIPAAADAVSVLTAPLTNTQIGRLVDGLIARKMPSFSFIGATDVELGFLAGMHFHQKVSRFARRIALNVQRVLLGADPADLPVAFTLETRLAINMATAEAIGVSPPWDMRLEADLLADRPAPTARHLQLHGVIREATRSNLDLAARQEEVAAGEQEIGQARANLLPQAEIGARGVILDEDRAASSFGSTAERTATASATVTQLLYSEKAHAGFGIQKQLQMARQEELEQLRLDVALGAATAFLDVLRANTLERIQRENLRLSQSNLDLAEVRRRIGVANASEVYRWQTDIAQKRNDLIQANSQRNLAEIQLNRVLNRPLEEPFQAEDVSLDEGLLTVDQNWLRRYVTDPVSFKRLRVWMVEEALRNAPELKAHDAAIGAQERALAAANRAYYVPTVALQGSYDRILDKSGAGAEGFALDPTRVPPGLEDTATFFGSVFPEPPDDDNWSVGVTLSLPLFSGGARRAEQLKARRELALAQRQREAIAQRVAQRARVTAHTAGASLANIKHSRDAAEAAARTLEVVTDAYARGAADILDLLDAQNATLVTDRVAANAVYDFLIDFLKSERAIGFFSSLLSEEERQAVRVRLDAFMTASETEP